MTKMQERNLNNTIQYLCVEGLDPTSAEKQVMIDMLEGRRSHKEILAQYVAEAYEYARRV